MPLARFPRRRFLADSGMGLAGTALAALLHQDGALGAEAGAPGQPHFAPKAKRVIWLFMIGGTSHMESFDPKPMLNKYAGKTIAETPFKATLNSPYLKNKREFVEGLHKVWPKIFPMQVGHQKRGPAGIDIADWWPHIAAQSGEIAFVRSMFTTDNDHGAQLQFHTGRHALEGRFPTIGSWTHYGLGALNEDLPQFVVLGKPLADCCGGVGGHGADYLGPEHDGVPLAIDPAAPLPFVKPGVPGPQQEAELALLRTLHRSALERQPHDAALRARVKSYELAFRMQRSIPEAMKLDAEPKETQALYGLDDKATAPFGRLCLAARRLAERGTRFVQVYHGSDGGAGNWDAHGGLKANHSKLALQVDKPIGGLLADLKRRGLLKDTLVVWATEFGRTPGAQGSDGRDHHPYGFTVWLAGAGVKGGVVHGATDELGFHAVQDRHYVTDLHATVLHLLGLDPRRLSLPGRKRLEIDYGAPIRGILA